MVTSLDEVLSYAETLVIGNGAEEFRVVPGNLKADQVVIDLVRIINERSGGRYDGICW
jgi:GDP-mannose 6-dehydrogenase